MLLNELHRKVGRRRSVFVIVTVAFITLFVVSHSSPQLYRGAMSDLPYDSIRPVADEDQLHFVIVAPKGRFIETTTCGGCTVLLELGAELESLGHSVDLHLQAHGPDCQEVRSHSVVIYPEVVDWTCKQSAALHVRWILAPIGVHTAKSITSLWGINDWVLNYDNTAPGIPGGVPDSNILMVLHNPSRFDEFDEYDADSSQDRQASCFTYRKAEKFHNMTAVLKLHPDDAIQVDGTVQAAVEIFKRCKHFYSYDPYTYLNFIASWFGCIPIVHPIDGLSKKDWLHSTSFGPYLRQTNSSTLIDIVAYGVSDAEVVRAGQVSSISKAEFYKIREWGKGTVRRFCADVSVYMRGGSNFNMRKLVREYYPDGW